MPNASVNNISGTPIGVSTQRQVCLFQDTLSTVMSVTCSISAPSPSSVVVLVDIQAPSDADVSWEIQNNALTNTSYNGIIYQPLPGQVVKAGSRDKFKILVNEPYTEINLFTQLSNPSSNAATIQFNY